MKGKSATTLTQISTDPADLDDGDFWAVTVDYEGNWHCAKFADVYDDPFPLTEVWRPSFEPWQSEMSREQYMLYVERIRDAIAQGDLYQCNACRKFSRPNDQPLESLFVELMRENPSPYASFLRTPHKEIASASPELFLEIKVRDGARSVKSSPIKGTSRTSTFLEKDSPENIMIVDLIRNDLGIVCEVGSIETPRVLAVEQHPGLYHLVSDVVGRLLADVDWPTISDRLLPAGSISGAPKSSAIKMIAANEATRGPYTGVIGWVHGDEAVLAVAIRTFWQESGRLHFGTGAGITWGSDASIEWDETELKAARLLEIADGRFLL